MYLQIEMETKDRAYHRFLWRNATDEVQVYEFNRIVFGVNSSPFLANFVNRENAKKFVNEFSRAVETILASTYMDDSMDSVRNDEESIRLYEDLQQILSKAGMRPRKWLSNSKKLMSTIPKPDIKECAKENNKALGIFWDHQNDSLSFQVKTNHSEVINTKRSALRIIAQIHDPLGLLAPLIVTAKTLIQDMWLEQLEWDEALPEHIQAKLDRWLDDLKYIENIRFRRWLGSQSNVK